MCRPLIFASIAIPLGTQGMGGLLAGSQALVKGGRFVSKLPIPIAEGAVTAFELILASSVVPEFIARLMEPIKEFRHMQKGTFDYKDGSTVCEGYVATDGAAGRKPCVLVAHQWAGLYDQERAKAEELARLGYLGFAIDVYGKGVRGKPHEDNSAYMGPFLNDRAKLKQRMLAAVEAAKARADVDPNKIAIIGYCFGGLCALDIARSGTKDVKGAVSLHGIFAPPVLGAQGKISTKVLVLHGWEDPMAKPNDVLGLAKEMTEAGADWQIHAYGHAMHAFTSESANAPESGVKYDRNADRRSALATENFLKEVFG